MTSIDLSTLSEAELKELISQAEQQQLRAAEEARQAAVKAVTEVCAQHGITPHDMAHMLLSKKKTKKPAKYAHPTDKSKVWTGHGRQPNWVKEHLAKGEDLESLKI